MTPTIIAIGGPVLFVVVNVDVPAVVPGYFDDSEEEVAERE